MPQIEKQKVLLTGCTGTVGSAVFDLLSSKPQFEIHVIVRQRLNLSSEVSQHLFDLSSEGLVNHLADISFDYIIDCSQPKYGEKDIPDDFEFRVVRNLESIASKRTRKLIYTSGVWVYGNQLGNKCIDENTTFNPLSYAKSRIAVLNYISDESKYPWVQLCLPSIVYGERGPLIEIKEELESSSTTVLDDEKILWSVIERMDLAEAYLSVMTSSSDEKEFMVAEKEPVPITSFYQQIANSLKTSFQPQFRSELVASMSKEDFEVISASQPINTELLRSTTGWRNRFSFKKDVARFL